MTRLDFRHFTFFATIVAFCFTISIPCIAQEETATISGTVLDTKAKPIVGFIIAFRPAMIQKGQVMPLQMLSTYPDSLTSKTDEKGAFTFSNVAQGPSQIVIPAQSTEKKKADISISQADFEPDFEIVSIKIGNVTLYQDIDSPFGYLTFAIKPGSNIKNVVVTVQPRMRIRTRILFQDKKPLINTPISYVIQYGPENNNTNIIQGTSTGKTTTNSEGYFFFYFRKSELSTDKDNTLTPYTVSVKYKGLSAKSEKILIEEGTRYDDLVLTLDGEAPPDEPTPSTSSRESLPNILRKLNKTPGKTDKPNAKRIIRHPIDRNPWVVNPANGHAYKKIRCSSLNDAQKQAAAEGAYLVAINDEAEQRWLSGIFGNHLFWIGLSDVEKEGQWVWQNGEPFTYTNWGQKQRFPRSTLSAEEKDAVIMTFINGTWQAVGPGDLFWRFTKQALIEKDKLIPNTNSNK